MEIKTRCARPKCGNDFYANPNRQPPKQFCSAKCRLYDRRGAAYDARRAAGDKLRADVGARRDRPLPFAERDPVLQRDAARRATAEAAAAAKECNDCGKKIDPAGAWYDDDGFIQCVRCYDIDRKFNIADANQRGVCLQCDSGLPQEWIKKYPPRRGAGVLCYACQHYGEPRAVPCFDCKKKLPDGDVRPFFTDCTADFCSRAALPLCGECWQKRQPRKFRVGEWVNIIRDTYRGRKCKGLFGIIQRRRGRNREYYEVRKIRDGDEIIGCFFNAYDLEHRPIVPPAKKSPGKKPARRAAADAAKPSRCSSCWKYRKITGETQFSKSPLCEKCRERYYSDRKPMHRKNVTAKPPAKKSPGKKPARRAAAAVTFKKFPPARKGTPEHLICDGCRCQIGNGKTASHSGYDYRFCDRCNALADTAKCAGCGRFCIVAARRNAKPFCKRCEAKNAKKQRRDTARAAAALEK